MNNNKNIKKGFTLVELLATIAILAIVVSIVIYVAMSTVNNAKENGYKTIVVNIENNAKDYFIENSTKLFFIQSEENENHEYQCVTVQNLIDMGYFKSNILESEVSKDRNVDVNDYVYLLRDRNSKALVKQIYTYGNDGSFNCEEAMKAQGDIGVVVSPNDWSKNKDITIYYGLKNTLSPGDYLYQYEYVDGSKKTISVNQNGTLYARIINSNDGSVLIDDNVIVNKFDNESPVIESLTQAPVTSITNWSNNSVTITAKVTDNGSGVIAYQFSKKSTPSNEGWINLENGMKNISQTYSASDSGLWYFHVKDVVGNTNSKSIEVYIDTIVPTFVEKSGIFGSGSMPTATFKDDQSGIKEVRYLIISGSASVPEKNHSGFAASNVAKSLSCGIRHYAYAVAVDNAGNISEVEAVGDFYTECANPSYSYTSVCDWLCVANGYQNSWWDHQGDSEKQNNLHQTQIEHIGKNCPGCTYSSDGVWHYPNGDPLPIYGDDKAYKESIKK